MPFCFTFCCVVYDFYYFLKLSKQKRGHYVTKKPINGWQRQNDEKPLKTQICQVVGVKWPREPFTKKFKKLKTKDLTSDRLQKPWQLSTKSPLSLWLFSHHPTQYKAVSSGNDLSGNKKNTCLVGWNLLVSREFCAVG